MGEELRYNTESKERIRANILDMTFNQARIMSVKSLDTRGLALPVPGPTKDPLLTGLEYYRWWRI